MSWVWQRLMQTVALARLATRISGGRFYWIVPLAPLAWPIVLILTQAFGEGRGYSVYNAQGVMSMPLVVLAIALGARVIAGEADRRTLEIAYTVPGGAQRIWTAKLLSAAFWLAVALLLLVVVTYLFLTAVPFSAVYGAYQAALVYLVLATGLSAVTRSEVTGVLVTIAVLFLNGLFTGFGDFQLRISPFWNPLMLTRRNDVDPADVLTWTVQNRIFMVLLLAALIALAYARAERREKMLAG
jgi:ABC-type transport system involved in multi-copper enzyme maturation permease subunit